MTNLGTDTRSEIHPVVHETARPKPPKTLFQRRPFTVGGTLLIAVLAMLTGTDSTPLLDHAWGPAMAYGPGALADGHVWTLVTGPLFAISPWCYLPVLASFVACAGYAEGRIGTLRTAALWAAGQIGSVIAGCWLIVQFGPAHLRHALDVGPSGGSLAVGAAITALLPTRVRQVLRLGLLGYAVAALFLIGHVADVVHLVAVIGGLAAGRLVRPKPAAVVNRDPAVQQLQSHGGGTLSWMTTWPGVRYLYDPEGEGYLAYRRHLGVGLVLGDPIGSPDWQRRAPQAFAEHCADMRLIPAHFGVTTAAADRVGGRRLQVGEDTLLDLPGLEYRGKRWQDIRTARNRADREGVELRLITLADADREVIAQVREISADWLHRQRTPELGFTLGGVDHAMDPRVRVAIAIDQDGVVHGFTSWLPVYGEGGDVRGWTLDLMRRRDHGFKPVIEFLIAGSCLAFRDEGAEVVSLSAAPLSRTGDEPVGLLQRGLERGAGVLEPLYGFASLHAFKAKFSPRCEPVHLAYRKVSDLPWVGAAVLMAYLVTPRTVQPVRRAARSPQPSALTSDRQARVSSLPSPAPAR